MLGFKVARVCNSPILPLMRMHECGCSNRSESVHENEGMTVTKATTCTLGYAHK